jgi:hypothetical protein
MQRELELLPLVFQSALLDWAQSHWEFDLQWFLGSWPVVYS